MEHERDIWKGRVIIAAVKNKNFILGQQIVSHSSLVYEDVAIVSNNLDIESGCICHWRQGHLLLFL